MGLRNLARLGGMMAAVLLALTFACSDDDGDGDNGSDNGATIPSSSPVATMTVPPENGEANDRDDFVTTVEAQLEQLQTQFDELEEEVAAMSGDSRSEAEERLQGLKDRKAEIEAKLEDVRSATEADYQARKVEIEGDVEAAMTEAQELAEEIGI